MAAVQIVQWARRTGKSSAIQATPVRQVPELRACALCMHSAGDQPGSALLCRQPTVIAVHGSARPVSIVRSTYGACGPDAHHLDMTSWQQHRRSN